jgi:predicted nucleic acid-binding Zn ribbon protein
VRRRFPRSLGDAVRTVRTDAGPETLLAATQAAWRQAAGETVAAQAEPVSERDGVITIACHSATWAHELDLLQGELLERLNEALGDAKAGGLRFTADAARHDSS